MFKKRENVVEIEEGNLLSPKFDNNGLIPVITTCVKTKEILKANNKIKYKNITHNAKVAKISIVGAGMVSTPGVTYRMFRGLADSNINILAISTSEIKLSVIIDEEKIPVTNFV